jgi:hypothetical protein
LKQLGEQFSRRSDKGLSLPVFIKTRGFSDKHDVSLRISCSKHHLGAS